MSNNSDAEQSQTSDRPEPARSAKELAQRQKSANEHARQLRKLGIDATVAYAVIGKGRFEVTTLAAARNALSYGMGAHAGVQLNQRIASPDGDDDKAMYAATIRTLHADGVILIGPQADE